MDFPPELRLLDDKNHQFRNLVKDTNNQCMDQRGLGHIEMQVKLRGHILQEVQLDTHPIYPHSL